jgi:hypothetical protein
MGDDLVGIFHLGEVRVGLWLNEPGGRPSRGLWRVPHDLRRLFPACRASVPSPGGPCASGSLPWRAWRRCLRTAAWTSWTSCAQLLLERAIVRAIVSTSCLNADSCCSSAATSSQSALFSTRNCAFSRARSPLLAGVLSATYTVQQGCAQIARIPAAQTRWSRAILKTSSRVQPLSRSSKHLTGPYCASREVNGYVRRRGILDEE